MNSTTGDARGGRVLLTGAAGYVGGQLLRRWESAGGGKSPAKVRCLTRSPEKLAGMLA